MTTNQTKKWGHPRHEDAARYIKYLPALAAAIENVGIGIYPLALTVDVLGPQFHVIVQNEDAGLAIVMYPQNDQFNRMWSFFGPQLAENDWVFIPAGGIYPSIVAHVPSEGNSAHVARIICQLFMILRPCKIALGEEAKPKWLAA